MKIGELALQAGTPPETIRFYEREGLLPKTGRTAGNYRVYGPDHAERLNFIRHCRSLDMALDEIRALLAFRDTPQADCTGVNTVLDEHIQHVAQRIRELRSLERQLKGLRLRCQSPDVGAACGILKGLESTAGAAPRKTGAGRHVHGAH